MQRRLGSPIMALRQKRANAQVMLDKAKAEGRDLTPEEAQSFDTIVAQLKAAEDELQREKEMGGGVPVPFSGRAGFSDIPDQFKKKSKGRIGQTYSQMFGRENNGGFNSMDDYLRAVHYSHAQFDPRLRMAATEDVPSDGGFAVPTEYAAQILDAAIEGQIVWPRAQVWQMNSETKKIPALRDEDHSGGAVYGGVTAAWADELETLADQTIKLRQLQLTANKLGMLSQASNELLEDSTFESVLGSALQAGARWHLDNAFLFGDGAGKPLGILDAGNTALLTVNKESSQPADSVVYENITKMFAAMNPRNRQNATWVFNDGLIPSLYAISNRVFNLAGSEVVGGSGLPVFTMLPDGTGVLLGRPVVFTEKLSAPGDLGDCLFCDFSAYAIGLRRSIMLEKSTLAGFTTDSSYFRLTCRIDGQPVFNAKLKEKSGAYVSPYVTLQAR